MSRWEFMRRLEELLSDISPSEREEALQYYNDYFNDAGRENEQEVIQALGSPEQVAQIVKEGIGGSSTGSFTEYGFTSRDTEVEHPVANRTGKRSEEEKAGSNQEYKKTDNHKTEDKKAADTEYTETYTADSTGKEPIPTWAIVLIVIGAILLSPAILGAVFTVIGTLLSILLAIFGIIFGFGVAAIVLMVVAVGLIAAGIGSLFVEPIVSIGLVGAACICGALGILFLLITVLIAGKGVPALYKGILYLWNNIFHKKGGVKHE